MRLAHAHGAHSRVFCVLFSSSFLATNKQVKHNMTYHRLCCSLTVLLDRFIVSCFLLGDILVLLCACLIS